jgi:hypothetical protein
LIPSAYKISVSVGSYSLLDISTTCKHMKIPINLIEKRSHKYLCSSDLFSLDLEVLKSSLHLEKKKDSETN